MKPHKRDFRTELIASGGGAFGGVTVSFTAGSSEFARRLRLGVRDDVIAGLGGLEFKCF